ncbi:MAG: hypothetical protein NVS1B10_08020 [Candidatus Saccharimonadales bacterium]
MRMKKQQEKETNGFSGTLYGINVLWTVNAYTGKVDMTPREVMESVEIIYKEKLSEVLEEIEESTTGLISNDLHIQKIAEIRSREGLDS